MKIRSLLALSAAALALAAAPAPAAAQHGHHGQAGDIVAVASANDDFETLVRAVQAADLVATLQGAGPFTVFAPTDAAFGNVPERTLSGLLADKPRLTSVLTYHVVPGRLTAEELMSRRYVTTVSGQRLPVRVAGGKVMVGNATVAMADVGASNGIIHVIDTVLMPPAGNSSSSSSRSHHE